TRTHIERYALWRRFGDHIERRLAGQRIAHCRGEKFVVDRSRRAFAFIRHDIEDAAVGNDQNMLANRRAEPIMERRRGANRRYASRLRHDRLLQPDRRRTWAWRSDAASDIGLSSPAPAAGCDGSARATSGWLAPTPAAQRMSKSYCQPTMVKGLAFECRMKGGIRIVVRSPSSSASLSKGPRTNSSSRFGLAKTRSFRVFTSEIDRCRSRARSASGRGWSFDGASI